jgi:hypothetical protein
MNLKIEGWIFEEYNKNMIRTLISDYGHVIGPVVALVAFYIIGLLIL